MFSQQSPTCQGYYFRHSNGFYQNHIQCRKHLVNRKQQLNDLGDHYTSHKIIMITQQDLQQLRISKFQLSQEHHQKVKIQDQSYLLSVETKNQKEKQQNATQQIKLNRYSETPINNDNKSVVSNFSTQSKRAPNIEDLCKSIELLRSKLPQRSLQQIVIRLHQAMQLKKQIDGDLRMGLINIQNRSEYSRGHDFDESQSLLNGFMPKGREQQKEDQDNQDQNEVSKLNTDPHLNLSQKQHFSGDSEEVNDKQTRKNVQLKYLQPNIDNIRMKYLAQKTGILEEGVNYIYRPRGRQITVRYQQKKTQKIKFINYEEEKRYHDQRIVAKSFVQRGHGVSQCRKEIEAQGSKLFMHRDTYRGFASSTIIFAFRKLESFIAIECGKTIKFLDKSQMQSIYTTLLNCRTNLEPQLVVTLFKFIRAGFGLNDVDIGEIESVKLYLACQKFLYGKHVTMQFLERLGKIQRKKDIQQTLQFLNRKKLKKEQRLAKLRESWKESKEQRKIYRRQMRKNKGSQPGTSDSSLKLQDIETSLNQASKSKQSKRSNKYALQTEYDQVKKQEEVEDDKLDNQIMLLYLKTQNIDQCLKLLQKDHAEIIQWNGKRFQRRFEKILEMAVEKLKAQIQIKLQHEQQFALIKHIGKRHLSQLAYSPFTQTIRAKLLSYFANQTSNPTYFKSLVNQLNAFLIQYEQMNQSVASSFKADELIDLSSDNFDIEEDKIENSQILVNGFAIRRIQGKESTINGLSYQSRQMSDFTDIELQNIKQEFLESNLEDFSIQEMELQQQQISKDISFDDISNRNNKKDFEQKKQNGFLSLMNKMTKGTSKNQIS